MRSRLSIEDASADSRPPIYPVDDSDDSSSEGWRSFDGKINRSREKENVTPSFLARIERPTKSDAARVISSNDAEEDDLRYSRHSSSKSLLSTDSLQMLNISLNESDPDSSIELSSDELQSSRKTEPLQEVIDLCNSPY
jgi:hypothetical protein